MVSLPGVAIALYASASPVGIELADQFWSVAGAVVIAQIAARARVWFLFCVTATGIIAGLASTLLFASALGVVALACFHRVGMAGRLWGDSGVGATLLISSASALTTLTLFNLDDFARPGLSALIAALLVALGLGDATLHRRRHFHPALARKNRRVATLVLATSVLAMTAWSGLEFIALRQQLIEVRAQSVAANSAGRAGDIESLATIASSVHHDLNVVAASLDSAPISLLGWTPLAGPNIGAMQRSNASLLEILAAGEALAEGSSNPTLTLAEGEAFTEDLVGSARTFDQTVASVVTASEVLGTELDSPWLAPPLREALTEVHSRFDAVSHLGEAASAADAVKSVLGVDAPRTYLILFANPAETRELGGFTGATAVISVDNGNIDLLDTVRNGILNETEAALSTITSPLPNRYLEHLSLIHI